MDNDFLVYLDSWRLTPKPHKHPRKRWKEIQSLTWILTPGVSWELIHAASVSSLLSPLECIQFHSTLTECKSSFPDSRSFVNKEIRFSRMASLYACVLGGTLLNYEHRRKLRVAELQALARDTPISQQQQAPVISACPWGQVSYTTGMTINAVGSSFFHNFLRVVLSPQH